MLNTKINIILLTSRSKIADRLHRQFSEVNWVDYNPGIADYTAYDAVLIVESVECKFTDELQEPMGGIYISVFKAWKNYLAEAAPQVKLMVAGFYDAKHPNYLPLHQLPGNFDLATAINQALPSHDPWHNDLPIAGEDVLTRLNLFYEGHHRDGIVMNLAKVRQCLNYAYYSAQSGDIEAFKDLWAQSLYPEINSARGLNARWVNYAPYFRLLPFYQQLEEAGITDFMADLNKFFSGPQKLSDKQLQNKQQAFVQFDGFQRLDLIQIALDLIFRRFVNPEIIGTMLVIDDDRRFQEQLEIDFPDFHITHVFSANEISAAVNRLYDIVLLDLQLEPQSGQLTGFDYIAQIKTAQPSVALIVVTTHSKTAIFQEAINNGADYCLRKQDFDLREWHHLFLHAAAGKMAPAGDPPPQWEQQATERAKILIIGNDDDTFLKLQALLLKETYEFTRAQTPQQAFDIIQEHGDYFELLVFCFAEDERMKHSGSLGNTPDVVPKIKKLLPQTPVMVIVGTSATEIAINAINNGASDYLEKDRYDQRLWQNRFNQYIELKRLRGVVNKFKMS